jgi:hypothetical protein
LATVCCTIGLLITGQVRDSYVTFVVINQVWTTPVCTSNGVKVLTWL